jgi:hypothetical protein
VKRYLRRFRRPTVAEEVERALFELERAKQRERWRNPYRH